MKLYQKIIIAILGVIAVVVTSVTVWATFAYKDANATFNAISKKIERATSPKREKAISYEDRDQLRLLYLDLILVG